MRLHIPLTLIFYLAPCILVSAYTLPNREPTALSVTWFEDISDRLLQILWPPQGAIDFWKEVQKLGENATKYVDSQLKKEIIRYNISSNIDELKTAIQDALVAAHDTQPAPGQFESQEILTGINMDDIMKDFNILVDKIIEQMREELSEPLPANRTERYKSREIAVDWVLVKAEDAFVKAYSLNGGSEDLAQQKFGKIRPHIKTIVLVTGNIADNHPILTDIIVFSALVMIAPEGLALRPLFRLFGMAPTGPVKGFPVAWCQRFFFGGAIPKGSWFSRLQQAGMKSAGGLTGWIRNILRILFG